MKTIYKKDSRNNIRYLTISTEGNLIVQEAGIVGTVNPTINKSVCESKNIGKTNETTPEEQAILEATSKITEKMRLGYFETIEDAREKGGKDFLLPMLAKDFKKEEKKVKYPFYAQPKLDGMRALGSEENTLMSRTGKIIDTISHIKFVGIGDYILDGELYAHGLGFQDNMKLLKKYRLGESEKIKFHVYDLIMNAPFNIRFGYLTAIVNNNPDLELVETVFIENKKELEIFHTKNIAAGYEGTIIRHSGEGYQVNKRSSQLLKYKDFLDEDYEVIDVISSEARPEQGVVVCKGKGGFLFNCGMKFSHKEREEILVNKENYVGQKANIRFFEYTDSGLPRFPVCYGFYTTLDR